MKYTDKYGKSLNIGDKVAFASVRKPHNSAYLNEGIIIDFDSITSVDEAIIKTIHNRKTKKYIKNIIKIY